MFISTLLNDARVSNEPIARPFIKHPHMRVLGVGFKKGVRLKEHTAPGVTKLVVIKGAIEYETTAGKKTLACYDDFDIPLSEVHAVQALEDSVVLLIITDFV